MNELRYVILHHKLTDGEHWDFMLEQAGVLATWQLATPPGTDQPSSIPAIRISDHRLAYLEYEGCISGDRGYVTRYDSGSYRTIEAAGDVIRVELHGTVLRGQYELNQVNNAPSKQWQFRGPNPPL